MHDMDFVAIGIAQIGAVIAHPVMRTRPGSPCIPATVRQSIGVGGVHCYWRRRQKGRHAAIADGCWFSVVRTVDIETRQARVRAYPAKRRWPTIGHHDPALQTKRYKHRVVKAA